MAANGYKIFPLQSFKNINTHNLLIYILHGIMQNAAIRRYEFIVPIPMCTHFHKTEVNSRRAKKTRAKEKQKENWRKKMKLQFSIVSIAQKLKTHRTANELSPV